MVPRGRPRKKYVMINWTMANTIIEYLAGNGNGKPITNIQMELNTKYKTCRALLSWMEEIEFVEEIQKGGRFNLWVLAEKGMDYYQKRISGKKPRQLELTELKLYNILRECL